MLSIVIPSRNEKYLTRTVQDLLEKAVGAIEIIVILDGYWCELVEDPRVRYLHRGQARGMRAGINAAARTAHGDFLMKLDAHCMVEAGFDAKLSADCPEATVVIPRRKRLDAERWELLETSKPDIDYEYLSCPDDSAGDDFKNFRGRTWDKRRAARLGDSMFLIDDNMCFQGSCWLMRRPYFEFLDLMDEENYGTFANEAVEIALKAWLSGGRVVVNKKTWYAHYHKPTAHGRGYRMSRTDTGKGYAFARRWIRNDTGWSKQTRPFSWLIEHFFPIPTWPTDWQERFPECTTCRF